MDKLHKTLKFAAKLVPLVMSGEKTSTWRLWDDKDLAEGDVVDLLHTTTKAQFASARVVRVITKSLGDLDTQDKIGHEQFANDQEMYNTYAAYYSRSVGPDTQIKIIWFELLK